MSKSAVERVVAGMLAATFALAPSAALTPEASAAEPVSTQASSQVTEAGHAYSPMRFRRRPYIHSDCDKDEHGDCPTEAERRAEMKEILTTGAVCLGVTVAVMGASRLRDEVDYKLFLWKRRKQRNEGVEPWS